MKARSTIAFLFSTLAICFAAGNASAIDKTGTYSGWFGFHSFGETVDMGNGNIYWYGAFNGAFRNDAEAGFLHNAAGKCPGVLSLVDGMAYYQGSCIMTDGDGDMAVLTWKCEAPAGERCDGPLTWAGGSGKYQGISGGGTFNGGTLSGTPQGYATWQGEWKLP